METLSYQKTFLDMNISQEDSHRSLSVPPRAKTTMMRHEDLEKHRADYATSLLARAAETFSWPVTQTETLGSHGHPEICGNPCIRFFYGNCQKGVDCQFCHLKHETTKKKLDKTQRLCFESLSEAQTLSMLLNHMEMRCRKQNLTAQMSLVLACMRRRLKALPKHEHVTPEMVAILSKIFKKLTLGRLLDLIRSSRNVPNAFKAELLAVAALAVGRPIPAGDEATSENSL